MFSTKIGLEGKYDFHVSKFQTAYDFLKQPGLSELAEGWYNLENGVRASVQHYETSDKKELSFESHEKYFDIQYLVSGIETIGVVSREGLVIKKEYDEDDDCSLYEDPESYGEVLLNPGDFVILAPEDVHKPRCCVSKPKSVVKIVCKVPV